MTEDTPTPSRVLSLGFVLAGLTLGLAACTSTPAPHAQAQAPAVPVSQALALQTFDSAWSRIAHTHYDTAFAGVDWQGVRDELRPRAAAVRTLTELRGVIAGMLERLGESHYALIPAEAADALGSGEDLTRAVSGDIGMEVRLVEGELLATRVEPDGPAHQAGIRPGWSLLAVDGRPVDSELGHFAALPEAERRVALTRLLMQVNAWLEGDVGARRVLRVRDQVGRSRDLDVVLRRSPGEMVRFGNLPPMLASLQYHILEPGPRCVGVIRMNVWMVPLMARLDSAVHAVRHCAGIVLDLRGNPGGVAGMVMGTAGHFLGDTVALGVMRTRTSELRFMANPRRVAVDGATVAPFSGPLAIVVDELSVSTTEIFAAGMQSVGRARVFGGRTAGQALPALMLRLPTNDVLMHAVADFAGPDGTRVEGDGVSPDVPVHLTRRGLLAGHDPALDTAVAWIRQTAGNPNGGSTP